MLLKADLWPGMCLFICLFCWLTLARQLWPCLWTFFGKHPNTESACSRSVRGVKKQIHFLIKHLAWMERRLQERAWCHSPYTLTPTARHHSLYFRSLCRGNQVQPRSDWHIMSTGSITCSHTTLDQIIISVIHMQGIHRVAYAVPKCVTPTHDGTEMKQIVFLKGCLVI